MGRHGSGRRKRQDRSDAQLHDTVARLHALLRQRAGTFHTLGAPATLLDAELPGSLAAVLRAFDGAQLFFEAMVLWPRAQVRRLGNGPGNGGPNDGPGQGTCFHVGEIEGDDLVVDSRDRVYRLESDTGEWLPEGSHFARWLHGAIEAAALLYDDEGEFAEAAFEDSGELSADVSARMYQLVLARDRKAPAPRWRLARVLASRGDMEAAREHLERVVEDAPGFAWAWFDLARISESLGQLELAVDELAEAAECRVGYEYAGFFWAHAARVAAALGDEARRAECARKALERDPNIARAQREGAAAMLEQGDGRAALELCAVALALTPRDLTALDLTARARVMAEAEPEPGDDDPGDEDDDPGR